MAKTLVTDTDISLSSLHQQLLIKPAASNDSTTVVQIQNSAGTVVLNVDTTNNRVGIGTVSPTAKLHVVGGKILLDNAQAIQFKDSLGTARPVLQVDGGDNLIVDATATNGDMYFRASGIDKMTIKSSGNTGIGITSPTAKLHVYGGNLKQDNGTYNLLISDGATITGSNHIIVDASLSYLQLKSNSNSIFFTQNSVNPFFSDSVGAVANTLYLKQGKVGIGTTTPAAPLQVVGADGFSIPLKLTQLNDGAGTEVTNIGFGAALAAEGANIVKAGMGLRRTNSFGRGFLDVYLNNTADTSDISATNLVGLFHPTGLAITTSTTAPNGGFQPLTVRGGSLFVASASSGAFLQLWKDEAGSGGLPTKAVAVGMSQSGGAPNNDLFFNTWDGAAWSTRMTVLNASGNVGIGTTTPIVSLDVLNPTATATVAILKRGLQPGNDTNLPTTFGNPYLQLGGGEWKTGHLISIGFQTSGSQTAKPSAEIGAVNVFNSANTYSALVFGTRSVTTDTTVSERMRIDQNGNVGIGITSPIKLLHVAGDALINTITVGLGAGSIATNTAVGNNALASNTTGTQNTALGAYSLNSNTTANRSTAIGYAALQLNTTGSFNTAVGYQALNVNTIGVNNAAFGVNSLQLNTTGVATFGTIVGGSAYTNGTYNGVQLTYSSGTTAATYPTANIVVSGGVVTSVTLVTAGSRFLNTTTVMTATAASIGGTGSGFTVAVATLISGDSNSAFGYYSLYQNTIGGGNSAFGSQSLYANTTGSSNSAFGFYSLYTNSTGSQNSAFGFGALNVNTSGNNNSSFGYQALAATTTGSNNTALGVLSQYTATTASYNTSVGYGSLQSNTGGNNTAVGERSLYNQGLAGSNVAFGQFSGYTLSTGSFNTFIGTQSSYYNTTGANNTSVGYNALMRNTTGGSNTAVGYQAGYYYNGTTGNNATPSNSIYIGNSTSALADAQTNQIVIGDSAIGAGSNTVTLGHTTIVTTILRGNVGIGTTTPVSKLEVNGAVAIGLPSSITGNYGQLEVRRVSSNNRVTAGFTSDTNYQTMGWLPGIDFRVGFEYSGQYHQFKVHNGAGGVTDALYIRTTTGNVGIRMTSPDYALDVSGVIRSSNGILNTNNTFEKVFSSAVNFPNGTANQAVDIRLGNLAIGGYIEVELTSTYSNQASYGKLTKLFAIGTNPNNAIYTNESRVSDALGTVPDNVAIGDISWDATNSVYKIPISHIVSTGNAYTIKVRMFADSFLAKPVFDAMTVSSIYTLTALPRNYVNYNGNVGIGTTSPGNKLAIVGSGAAIRITGTNDTSAVYSQFNTSANTGLGYVGVEGNTAGSTLANTLAYATFISAGSSGSALQLGTPGGIRATILASGNVGIGTTTPGYTLDASGTINASTAYRINGNLLSDASRNILIASIYDTGLTNQLMTFGGADVTVKNGISLTVGGTSTFYNATASTGSTLAAFRAGVAQSTNPILTVNNNANTVVFSVLASGNVGIGTSVPTASLQIGAAVGYTRTTPAIAVPVGLSGFKELIEFGSDSRGGGLTGYQDGSGLVRVSLGTRTSSTVSEQLCVLNSGNVGIGTIIPGALLQVGSGTYPFTVSSAGVIKSGTTDSNGSLNIRQPGNGNQTFIIQRATDTAPSGAAFGVLNHSNSAFLYYLDVTGNTSQSGVLTVSGTGNSSIAGNVGIGITTPATKLQVAGGKILLDNAQAIQFKDSLGTARPVLQVDGGDNVYLDSTAAGGDMYFRASGAEKMTIKGTSGNVGIGKTAPNVRLDVLSGSVNTAADSLTASTMTVTGPNVVFGASANNAGVLNVETNDTLGANVGGSIGFGGRYTGTAQAQWALIKGAKENATDGDIASYLAFGTRAVGTQVTERMRITSAGNVGIGTASPSKLLHVAGDALINGITVGLGTGSIAGNTALGQQTLLSITSGYGNTAIGYVSGSAITTGSNNTALGYNSGSSVSTGSNNIAIGQNAGTNQATGTYNVYIGAGSYASSAGVSSEIVIGAVGGKGSNTTYISGSTVYHEGSIALKAPTTVNAATYSMTSTDSSLIITTTNCTITLLSAATYTGRILYIKNITANSLTSNASNVVPLGSATAGTAILAATAGKFAMLQSDGTSWITMMSN